MTLVVMTELSAKDDSIEKLANYIKEDIHATRAFEGCNEVKVYRNNQSSSKFVLVSRWISEEASMKYITWRMEKGDGEKLSSLCSDINSQTYSVFDE